jgi:hypothetical protein
LIDLTLMIERQVQAVFASELLALRGIILPRKKWLAHSYERKSFFA